MNFGKWFSSFFFLHWLVAVAERSSREDMLKGASSRPSTPHWKRKVCSKSKTKWKRKKYHFHELISHRLFFVKNKIGNETFPQSHALSYIVEAVTVCVLDIIGIKYSRRYFSVVCLRLFYLHDFAFASSRVKNSRKLSSRDFACVLLIVNFNLEAFYCPQRERLIQVER